LIRSAPSNEFISASYEAMIFERYPEERGSRYQLEMARKHKLEEDELQKRQQEEEAKQAERARQAEITRRTMKSVKITGGEWKGEICTVLEDKNDDEILVEFAGQRYKVSKTGRGGVVVTDVAYPVANTSMPTQNNTTVRALCSPTTVHERVDSANDPFRSLLPSKRCTKRRERLHVHPMLGPLPSEDSDGRTPSRGPTPGSGTPIPRDRLGFTPLTSAGSEISAKTEFLEGWIQFGVQSLRSGRPLPPLSGVNPSRRAALQAAKGRQGVRNLVRSAGAIDALSGQGLRATPTARLSFSGMNLDEPTQRPHSEA
jgi:hypothetical protein